MDGVRSVLGDNKDPREILARRGCGERDYGSYVILREARELAQNHVDRLSMREIAENHTNEYAGSLDDGLAAADGRVTYDAVVIDHRIFS